MKRNLVILTMLIASASSSFAQVSFGGGAQSGLAFTSIPKPMTEYYGIGFGGGAHGDLNILPALALRLAFDYNTFASDKTKLKTVFTVRDANGNLTNNFNVEGANITILGITANVLGKIATGSSVQPYGLLGFGLQIFNQSDLQVVSNGQQLGELRGADGTTNFGLNFGAGIEFGLGRRTNLFLETKYVLFFSQGGTSSYIPVTFGVTF